MILQKMLLVDYIQQNMKQVIYSIYHIFKKYIIVEDTTDSANANQIDLWLGPPNHSNIISEGSLNILPYKVNYSGTVGGLEQCHNIDIFGQVYGLHQEPELSYDCDNITDDMTTMINFYYNYIPFYEFFSVSRMLWSADTESRADCPKGQTPSSPPGTCICVPTH